MLASKPFSFFPDQTSIELKKESFFQALLAAMMTGAYDAHFANINLNDEGRIKFTDTSRSFAQSNVCLDLGAELSLPFVCQFMRFGFVKENLTEDDLELLKDLAKVYPAKLEILKREFENRNSILNYLKRKLPPGFFNKKAVLDSLEERITNINVALTKG